MNLPDPPKPTDDEYGSVWSEAMALCRGRPSFVGLTGYDLTMSGGDGAKTPLMCDGEGRRTTFWDGLVKPALEAMEVEPVIEAVEGTVSTVTFDSSGSPSSINLSSGPPVPVPPGSTLVFCLGSLSTPAVLLRS
eukprot:CAMPEP_0197555006 /NCGR_PEP_ID=MMETSP1320-20131121/12482_1 /TAXON_ID=91990 /ORGANISM="Bolidomonas sp., Strain RCC2347" /LENGTH=133 /DNA_ID=CAMNT_0043115965 /DNA_START=589 /DNA_END=986 /DNA_ORIENTATION=-